MRQETMHTRANILVFLTKSFAAAAVLVGILGMSETTAQEFAYGTLATDSVGRSVPRADSRPLPGWMASTGIFDDTSESPSHVLNQPSEGPVSDSGWFSENTSEETVWSTGLSRESFASAMLMPGDGWCWQLLPTGLIYRSYMASVREPRFAAQWVKDRDRGWVWDIALGGRVGIVRYGSRDALRPEGWQLDMEGAALPRLDMEEGMDLMATDYRIGAPLTYGRGRHQTKLAFYHLSSHLGDEFMEKNVGINRINYSRDVVVLGQSYYWTDDVRLYGEAAWAYRTDGGTRPWEFQFGIDYSPAGPTGFRPVPFFAINTHLRQEVDFGGNLVVQSGFLWRGLTGHMFRVGAHYFTGMSEQGEFFRQFEDKVGVGMWYDY